MQEKEKKKESKREVGKGEKEKKDKTRRLSAQKVRGFVQNRGVGEDDIGGKKRKENEYTIVPPSGTLRPYQDASQ